MQLLADRLVELHESRPSRMKTIRRVLKKQAQTVAQTAMVPSRQ